MDPKLPVTADLHQMCIRDRLYADVIPNPNKEKLPDRAREWDRRTTSPGHAYQEMFNRRLLRGQSYMTPFLGWSEFTLSYFGPFPETTTVRCV